MLKQEIRESPVAEGVRPRNRGLIGAVVILVLAVVGLGAWAIVESNQTAVSGEAAVAGPATQVVQEIRSEQRILADLASRGYIPSAAVDWRLLRTEELANRGLIPAETLEPYRPAVEPLFSDSELLMMELARTGRIPRQAVDWGEVELKRLVNQGLIPREALSD